MGFQSEAQPAGASRWNLEYDPFRSGERTRTLDEAGRTDCGWQNTNQAAITIPQWPNHRGDGRWHGKSVKGEHRRESLETAGRSRGRSTDSVGEAEVSRLATAFRVVALGTRWRHPIGIHFASGH